MATFGGGTDPLFESGAPGCFWDLHGLPIHLKTDDCGGAPRARPLSRLLFVSGRGDLRCVCVCWCLCFDEKKVAPAGWRGRLAPTGRRRRAALALLDGRGRAARRPSARSPCNIRLSCVSPAAGLECRELGGLHSKPGRRGKASQWRAPARAVRQRGGCDCRSLRWRLTASCSSGCCRVLGVTEERR